MHAKDVRGSARLAFVPVMWALFLAVLCTTHLARCIKVVSGYRACALAQDCARHTNTAFLQHACRVPIPGKDPIIAIACSLYSSDEASAKPDAAAVPAAAAAAADLDVAIIGDEGCEGSGDLEELALVDAPQVHSCLPSLLAFSSSAALCRAAARRICSCVRHAAGPAKQGCSPASWVTCQASWIG